jgi:hypothetical protein
MAISTYAFQPRRWNARYDDLQTVTGLFGSWSGTSFITASCEAGFLCNKGDGIPAGGAYMTAASDGTTTLYACNPCDVERLSDAKNTWAVGAETLGLGLPLGKKGPFTEIKVGETYAFAPSNFSTIVTTTNKYATVSDGLLVGASELDSSFTGYYFELDTEMGIDFFVEGNYNAFSRYNLVAKHI